MRDYVTRIREAGEDCAETTHRTQLARDVAETYRAEAEKLHRDSLAALKGAQDDATQAKEAAARTLRLAEQNSELVAEALARAKANAPGGSPAAGPSMPMTPFVSPTDGIATMVGQLNNLVLGSTPAFATAMRMCTDSMASGIASHNAVSHQYNQSTTALLARKPEGK